MNRQLDGSVRSTTLGQHILLDLWGVSQRLLDDADALEAVLAAAAEAGGAHVVERRMHRFEPLGVSGVVILAESHLAVHTWPESGFAAVDVFTCGSGAVAEAVADEVIARLAPASFTSRRVERGAAPAPRLATAGARR